MASIVTSPDCSIDRSQRGQANRIRAISICQPWAWAIVAGLKRIENRNWPTRHRGPVLIHASVSRTYKHRLSLFSIPPDWRQLPRGAIVGAVDVVDCVPLAQVAGEPFASGPWCFLLENAQIFAPIPCLGASYFFDPAPQLSAIQTSELRQRLSLPPI